MTTYESIREEILEVLLEELPDLFSKISQNDGIFVNVFGSYDATVTWSLIRASQDYTMANYNKKNDPNISWIKIFGDPLYDNKVVIRPGSLGSGPFPTNNHQVIKRISNILKSNKEQLESLIREGKHLLPRGGNPLCFAFFVSGHEKAQILLRMAS